MATTGAMLIAIELTEIGIVKTGCTLSNFVTETLVIIYSLLVTTSRFYLGVHTFLQLVLGLCFGVWGIVLLQNGRRLLEKKFFKYLKKIQEDATLFKKGIYLNTF